ncbi:MAG TPA: Hpt domain-containing protein [Bryobacteraceae bacterium]
MFVDNSADSKVLDPDAIIDRVGGDAEFLQELTGLFAEDSPKLLGQIRSAIAAGDPRGLEYAAHALKGSVANFGAESARAAALRLELLGRAGDLQPAPEACAVLEQEIARFTDALEAFARKLNTL